MEISLMDRDRHSLITFTHSYSLDAFHEKTLFRTHENQTVMTECSQLPLLESH